MSDVHETLVGMRKAQEYLDRKRTRGEDSIIRDLLSAVEKVLELHHLADWDYDHTETRCASCFDVYPCPTVQTIQESLGGVNHG